MSWRSRHPELGTLSISAPYRSGGFEPSIRDRLAALNEQERQLRDLYGQAASPDLFNHASPVFSPSAPPSPGHWYSGGGNHGGDLGGSPWR
jgi:hypothetical protein